jgi:hypothetical protein
MHRVVAAAYLTLWFTNGYSRAYGVPRSSPLEVATWHFSRKMDIRGMRAIDSQCYDV